MKRGLYSRGGKRFADVTVSLIMFVLLFPLAVTISLLVWLKIGAPIIFRQIRPGINGKPFPLIKFRSMSNERDDSGEALPDADRLTDFGKLLRSTSLDELPELWNVFRGHMSLIGPRPLLLSYLPLYSADQMKRHRVRPGITGWAQVNGRNALPWKERIELDVWYVDNVSLILDLRICWRTLNTVLRRRGVSAPGEVTSTPFEG